MAEDVLIGGKKLSELKVTELKSELDKRGLQKAGVKSVLMDRLRRAVLREENSVRPGHSGIYGERIQSALFFLYQDLAAVNDEGDEINVEELSDGENNGEREVPETLCTLGFRKTHCPPPPRHCNAGFRRTIFSEKDS